MRQKGKLKSRAIYFKEIGCGEERAPAMHGALLSTQIYHLQLAAEMEGRMIDERQTKRMEVERAPRCSKNRQGDPTAENTCGEDSK